MIKPLNLFWLKSVQSRYYKQNPCYDLTTFLKNCLTALYGTPQEQYLGRIDVPLAIHILNM